MGCGHEGRSRRAFLGLLGVGLAAVATGCDRPPARAQVGPAGLPLDPGLAQLFAPVPSSGQRGAAASAGPPGRSEVLRAGPPGTRRIALTVDDGFCANCVSGYVDFVQRTGIHLTFCPNGVYAREWEPHAPTLRPLIEAGQLQLMNHTFTHLDLTRMPAAKIRAELERNEDWIARAFGTTTRPYFRPPFGRHNPAVDGAASAVGFARATLWNGSYSDSKLITPRFLMDQARRYLQPGVIMLGHANHPTVLGLFDQILDLIRQRQLEPVTLDEMFGTARTPAPH